MDQEAGSQRDYARCGRFIYGFARHVDLDMLRAAPSVSGLAPEAHARGVALAARFDAVMASWQHESQNDLPDSVGDEQLRAILDEAEAFARDNDWRYGVPRIE